MRTTIQIDDDLLSDVKVEAARSGRTLSAFVTDALREALARRRAVPRGRVHLPEDGGSGLQPGVDLSDRGAVLDLMDGIRAPR